LDEVEEEVAGLAKSKEQYMQLYHEMGPMLGTSNEPYNYVGWPNRSRLSLT
jgi:hypothetical protein